MNDLEEFESWHEDLMEWERFQDELERIKGEEKSQSEWGPLSEKARKRCNHSQESDEQ